MIIVASNFTSSNTQQQFIQQNNKHPNKYYFIPINDGNQHSLANPANLPLNQAPRHDYNKLQPRVARADRKSTIQSINGRFSGSDHERADYRAVILPSGPPPFRPSSIILGLNSMGLLKKLKKTKIFKRMYKSKVYYLFLDTLQQLAVLAEKVSKKKLDIAEANMATIQAVTNKLVSKGGQNLKLKWPLVMLNPQFLRELLSSPTFLVMLFHAIEVAYMSTPINFWLKPLVKLVKQPSPKEEEQIWWRRKRLYDTLNGHGASELQPNLRSIHFKQPGEPTPVAFPHLVQMFRDLTGRPAPNPDHYKYPVNYQTTHEQPSQTYGDIPNFAAAAAEHYIDDTAYQQPATKVVYTDEETKHQEGSNDQTFMTAAQEESFLANQIQTNTELGNQQSFKQQHQYQQQNSPTFEQQSQHQLYQEHETSNFNPQGGSQPNWMFDLASATNTGEQTTQDQIQESLHKAKKLNEPKHIESIELPNIYSPANEMDHYNWLSKHRNHLMTHDEFQLLDPQQRELVLNEAKRSLWEAGLADNIIKKQTDFVESFTNRRRDDDLLALSSLNGNLHDNPIPNKAYNDVDRMNQQQSAKFNRPVYTKDSSDNIIDSQNKYLLKSSLSQNRAQSGRRRRRI